MRQVTDRHATGMKAPGCARCESTIRAGRSPGRSAAHAGMRPSIAERLSDGQAGNHPRTLILRVLPVNEGAAV